MSWFGLKESVVAPLVRQVSGYTDDEALPMKPDATAERFARATWTGIAEPGDRVAGALVAALGASAALESVLERWSVERTLACIAESARMPVGEPGIAAGDLAAAQARWHPRIASGPALVALQQAGRFGVRLLVPGDHGWPSGVDDLGRHAPIALWMRGRIETLATHSSSIALVGARAATGYGEHVTMEASAGLVDRGYTIVSGAAYGIDGMAHRAALAGSGHTIAFLAGGVDRFYPSGHDALLHRIVEAGAVVSELPCGSPPTKWRFLQRNRLIAASSLATVVLEAGRRSGSLNTAGHAAALGRPLGAVPGPVTSAASAGCHRLIRDFDAICVTDADEMAELAPLDLLSAAPIPGGPDESPDVTRVVDALSARSARPTADIAARAGLSVSRVQSVLGILELEGRAAARERGWVSRSSA